MSVYILLCLSIARLKLVQCNYFSLVHNSVPCSFVSPQRTIERILLFLELVYLRPPFLSTAANKYSILVYASQFIEMKCAKRSCDCWFETNVFMLSHSVGCFFSRCFCTYTSANCLAKQSTKL